MDAAKMIAEGKTAPGIEFGSTRIKAVLIGEGGEVLESGIFEWENSLIDGIRTYSEEEIKRGGAGTVRIRD